MSINKEEREWLEFRYEVAARMDSRQTAHEAAGRLVAMFSRAGMPRLAAKWEKRWESTKGIVNVSY